MLYDKNVPSNSLAPNKIENVCNWLNTDSIFKNFSSDYKEYKNLDSVFSLQQKESLDQKFRNLESISLDKERLKPVYEIRDSSYFKRTFPVIQQSKDGSLYAFIYEESESLKSFGKMRVEKKVVGDWKIIGMVLVPRYDPKKLKKELVELPDEYQVINSYLAGKDDFVQGKYIPFYSQDINFDSLEKFEEWDQIGFSGSKLKDHFTKHDLQNMVRHFKQASSADIEKDYLLGDLERTPREGYSGDLDGKDLYSFSKPYVFVSSITCETYAVLYVTRYGGMLNGSGGIIIMKKIDGVFERVLSGLFWFS